MPKHFAGGMFCVIAALHAIAPASADTSRAAPGCYAGAYRNSSGAVLALAPTAETGVLRYFALDGRSGLLRPEGRGVYVAGPHWQGTAPVVVRARLGDCGSERISLELPADLKGTWTRVPLKVTDTRFVSSGTALAGRLIEPPEAGSHPAIVLVHGSASTPYLDREPWQWLFPAKGVSVFVFDKRGTGASDGIYTQDFDALANDVVAAVTQARKLGEGRFERLGLLGLSQGGWVAPLAATRSRVDFIQIGYGVVGTPIEQDQWQVAYELQAKRHGESTLVKARALTELTGRIAASDFRTGRGELEAFQSRYRGEPWLTQFEGQYTGLLLRGEFETAREESPGVSWHYDSQSVLRQLSIPQLWIMAEEDSLAPSAPTVLRLRRLQAEGKPIEIAIFPDTDHGIFTFERRPDGSRERVGYAAGYFALQIDWIKRRVSKPYGKARFIDGAMSR